MIHSFHAGLQRFREGAMPRILGNPITFEEIESAKKSNLKFGEIERLEELLGDDGLFEEFGVAEATEIIMECTCCGDESTLTTGTQLQAHENAATEEREEAELLLPHRACMHSEERSVDLKK
jgi:hypothetical protein